MSTVSRLVLRVPRDRRGALLRQRGAGRGRRRRSPAPGLDTAPLGALGRRLGGGRLLVGTTRLPHGQCSGDDGGGEQDRGGGEERPQPAVDAGPLAVSLVGDPFGDVLTGGDELPDQRADVGVPADELVTGEEACAAVQVVVVAAVGVPRPGGGTQLTFEDELGAGLLEPGGELRPGAEHDLVDDVDLSVVALHQVGVDQGIDGAGELVGDLVDRHPPANPLPVLGDVDEAQHDLTDALFVAGSLRGPGAHPLDGRGRGRRAGRTRRP